MGKKSCKLCGIILRYCRFNFFQIMIPEDRVWLQWEVDVLQMNMKSRIYKNIFLNNYLARKAVNCVEASSGGEDASLFKIKIPRGRQDNMGSQFFFTREYLEKKKYFTKRPFSQKNYKLCGSIFRWYRFKFVQFMISGILLRQNGGVHFFTQNFFYENILIFITMLCYMRKSREYIF